MKKQLLFFVLSIWTITVLVRCDDTTIIGGDLLNDESIELVFTDTTTIHTSTVPGKAINSGRLTANTFMVGALEDPVFGLTTADLYLGLQIVGGGPNFVGKSIDSMVLVIAYDTVGFYGRPNALFDLELFRTTETINNDTTFSDETLPLESTPVTTAFGQLLSPDDSLQIYDPELDTLMVSAPQFRLRIDSTLESDFYELIRLVTDDGSLLGLVPALNLKGLPDRSSMAGFSLGNLERLGDFNKFILYFTDTIGLKSTYEFRFGIDRFNHFIHDYSGSQVEPFLDGSLNGDSLFFIQGMAGVNGAIDISSTRQYEGYLINKAEIELTIAQSPEYDLQTYPPINLYGASFEGSDGNLIVIEDLDLISDFGFGVYGGALFEEEVNGETLKKVKLNITNHVKNFINDPTMSSKIVLTSFFESETPNRTVFYGAGHSKYPAKLNIALTKP